MESLEIGQLGLIPLLPLTVAVESTFPVAGAAILCAKVLTLVWAAFGVVLGQIPT